MTYIALLRGINVGGHKQVAMGDLRDLLTRLGFTDPRSLLVSGNLLFGCNSQSSTRLERLLETEVEKHLALKVGFFVRTAKEWKEVIANNPFPKEAKSDPGHLIVLFLKQECDRAKLKTLQASIQGPELIRGGGRYAYVYYAAGQGRSRLTHAVIEKVLGTGATGRNWNTVLKLDALASAEKTA